jgi:NAD(P)-dependent dehydrogenase (short-subunit alcohol dehydrogenase family)
MVGVFSRLGHSVAGCGRTEDEVTKLTFEYPSCHFRVVDVASDAQVRRWAQEVIGDCGPPAFVLNNAAVLNERVPSWEIPTERFQQVVATNLVGVANVVRHYVPVMISRRCGVVVNFTSRWSTRVQRLIGPYCCTKWGLVALTKVLAAELRPLGVSVVGLNPGIVATEMLRQYLGDAEMKTLESYPSPTEWAEVAVPRILRLYLSDAGSVKTIRVKKKA